MKVLKKIFRRQKITFEGEYIRREAVRAVILRNGKILLNYSPITGDYSFPGGGRRFGESIEEALIREVKEETGAIVNTIVRPMGKVLEFDQSYQDKSSIFCMTNYYFFCKIEKYFEEQALESYEEELQFSPKWTALEEALKINHALLKSKKKNIPKWTPRETWVLEYIRETI